MIAEQSKIAESVKRLRQLVKDVKTEYARQFLEGGEMTYPEWINDVERVCNVAEKNNG